MAYVLDGTHYRREPDYREDGVFGCSTCVWFEYYRYAEDAPESCALCGAPIEQGDMESYEDDLAADAADREYDRRKEGD